MTEDEMESAPATLYWSKYAKPGIAWRIPAPDGVGVWEIRSPIDCMRGDVEWPDGKIPPRWPGERAWMKEVGIEPGPDDFLDDEDDE